LSYRVVLDPRAQKQLDALDARTAARIAGALRRVATNPYAAPNVKTLKGGGFRLRVGDWRVLYDLRDDLLVVLVARVAHRREVYRRGRRKGA
jgi:mRNA interferase RelE/StbE